MKKIIRFLLVLVVLLIVLLTVAFFAVDRIAKQGVERGATYALDVNTTVDHCKVGVLNGEFGLAGLTVTNPPGFQSDHFLRLVDGGMAVSLGTLMDQTVEVPKLTLRGIDVNLEKKQGKANYQVILDNLGRFESSSSSAPSEGKRFVIRDLVIQDVAIHVDLLPIAGKLTNMDLKVPEIHLKNIGTGNDKGVPIAELTDVLVKAILRAAVEKGGGLIPADLLGDLSGSLAKLKNLESVGVEFASEAVERVRKQVEAVHQQVDDAKKKVTETIKKTTGQIDKARKGVEEGAGKVLEGVGGLFDKKKKDQQ